MLSLILVFALLPIINPSMFQQQNKQQAEADGAPAFGEVSFRQGTRIVMNDGKKSATFLKDKQYGGKLTDTWFLSDQVNSNVTIHDYGEDKIIKDFKNECSPDAAAEAIKDDVDARFRTELYVSDLKEYSHLLPKTTDSFWLRNGEQDFVHKELQYAAYANADNTLPNNVLKVSGYIGGWTYDNTQIAKGPYAWSSDVEVDTGFIWVNPTVRAGGIWSSSGNKEMTFSLYGCSDLDKLVGNYGVYNNPWLKSITGNNRGDKGVFLWGAPLFSDTRPSIRIMGYVDEGVVYQAKRGDRIKKGMTVLVTFTPTKEFQSYKDYDDRTLKYNGRYYGFIEARGDVEITGFRRGKFTIGGFDSVYENLTSVKGESIVAQKKHWRPGFRIDPSQIAFFRKADNSDVRISNQLSPNNMPTSVADSNNSYKIVLKDDSMGLSQSLASFATDKGEAKIESGTVHVPYGAKTLTIKNLKKKNANYISALSDKDGTKKYSILGSGSDVTIDLKSIINTQVVQDSATVSLFAEQLNGAGTSDKISSEPFSFKIQVAGSPCTLTYDADGGSGVSLPKPATVYSGSSVTLADGSRLTKDGNPFSKWLVTYKNKDENYTTKLLMSSSQILTMPNADVTVTALYSGISAGKDSTTEGQEKVLVTFDPNGGLWGSSTKPISVPITPGSQCPDPGNPTRSGYTFLGWFDKAVGGKNIVLKKEVFTSHTSLYAHWFEGDSDVFMAPVGTDPTKINAGIGADLIGINEIKAAAKALASGEKNPNPDVFDSKYHENYHLFAKISGDGSEVNDWMECRIIHAGQHDGDGSGLTFQAIHAWPKLYKWDTNWSSGQTPSWASCTLRSTMNGSIFDSLPSGLQNSILPVAKKYNTTAGSKPNGGNSAIVTDKLWIISTTELVNVPAGRQPSSWDDSSHQGSTYSLWSMLGLRYGSVQPSGLRGGQYLYAMNCTRSGKILTEWTSGDYAESWVRSLNPNVSGEVMDYNSNGAIGYLLGSRDPSWQLCISPCFAM